MRSAALSAFTLVCSLFFAAAAQADRCQQIRAGLDIGSGTTKVAVARVNVCQLRIEKVLYQDQRAVAWNDALAHSADNQLNPAITQEGVAALQQLVAHAKRFHPQRISGVATAVFRNASNGQAVIEQLQRQTGAEINIISQEQEAKLGFLSAKAALNDPAIRDEQLLVWDIGGGSMQMTAWRQQSGKLVADIYQGKLASVTLKNFILTVLKNSPQVSSPNPIGSWRPSVLRFVQFYATNEVSPQIKQDVTGRRVIGIGGVHGFSIRNQLPGKPHRYTLTELQQLSQQQVWKGDSELSGDYRATDVSNLLLVEGFMQALKIDQVTLVEASLIQGVLLQ
ncbi:MULTISPECIES: Ppx/GppA phosphatase family protein [Pantoea]|uniref:Ppx/GppA phosphatase family protein n=1 Tax=Pantoea TaxID=53335 RepID=UPI0002A6A469|nr:MULTISPECIES: exopolyphosphatase [Pantoea]ELP25041.1 putative exopolyphosphatase [Pantoea agglomerans 299R]